MHARNNPFVLPLHSPCTLGRTRARPPCVERRRLLEGWARASNMKNRRLTEDQEINRKIKKNQQEDQEDQESNRKGRGKKKR